MILFKYKSVEYIEDIIINKRLYCSRYDALNDPMEWAFTSTEEKENVQKLINDTDKDSWRICCLSASKQYGLMWAMYGDSHRGVCIEVEILPKVSLESLNQENTQQDELGNKEWRYGRINYKNNAEEIVDMSNGADLPRILWTKSKQWEQEQEIRFVRRLDVGENVAYLPIEVRCVYLGRRIDADKAYYIEKLCAWNDIKCIRMHYDDAPSINYWKNWCGEEFKDEDNCH